MASYEIWREMRTGLSGAFRRSSWRSVQAIHGCHRMSQCSVVSSGTLWPCCTASQEQASTPSQTYHGPTQPSLGKSSCTAPNMDNYRTNQLKRGFMWRFFWRRHFFRERLAASAASLDFQIFKGLQHWCYRISWLLHCKARGHRTMRWFHHNGISVNNFDFIWRSWPMHAFINCLQWDKLCEMPDILKFWVIKVWKSERAGNEILHLHIHVYGRIFCNDFNLLREWMVKIMENPMNKWMIWGYHYFWKHPCVFGFFLKCHLLVPPY